MKSKPHKQKNCTCGFCKIVRKLPKNHLINTFYEFMDDHGYDAGYIFAWNMPSWYREGDLEDPSIFYFIILPFLAERYNLDILDYLDRIPEMSKWILNASEKDIDLLFGGSYE